MGSFLKVISVVYLLLVGLLVFVMIAASGYDRSDPILIVFGGVMAAVPAVIMYAFGQLTITAADALRELKEIRQTLVELRSPQP